MPRIYLDTCCWNRAFDDQRQERVRSEAEAVLDILRRGTTRELVILRSDAVVEEAAAISDPKRRRRVEALMDLVTVHIRADSDLRLRGRVLEGLGFRGYDSLHLACAEAAGADVLLTTDDALIRRARRLQHQIGVRVENPTIWLKERPE